MKHLFCFGLGYSAQAIADVLRSRGWRITGTATSEEKCEKLTNAGVEAMLFTRDHPLPSPALATATHVLSSVPPDESGDPVIDVHGRDLALLPALEWAGLLSTTGVYGDRGGAWVDEETDLAPTAERSARRVRAEAQWLDLHRKHRVPVHVFRLAGIYGPGRNPLDAIRAGTARRVIKPDLVLGRIHRDDIAGAILASMERPNPGAVYNVTDDEPAPPQDVVSFGCSLLGKEPPAEVGFDEAEMSPMARSFYLDNKRVRNDRLKSELGYRLKFPTYRDGLRALLSEPPQVPRRR
jgi:nucleoside-diphosphate-sugar epimerase